MTQWEMEAKKDALKTHLIIYRNRNELDSTRLYYKSVGNHQRAMYTLALHKTSYSVCNSKVRMASLDFQESVQQQQQQI